MSIGRTAGLDLSRWGLPQERVLIDRNSAGIPATNINTLMDIWMRENRPGQFATSVRLIAIKPYTPDSLSHRLLAGHAK